MKRLIIILFALLPLLAGAESKLQRQGNRTNIVIDGRPMLILGGELSNSAVTAVDDVALVMAKMHAIGLNTVLVPAYWDLTEPVEGKFDFSLTDRVIEEARKNQLKVVFLWFGAWKNSMSCYAPLWFKEDVKRFPRAITAKGKPLEIASAFSENVFQADNRAFCKWLRHVADIDKAVGTVIMVQIENEIGMLEDARDHSPEADKAFNAWNKSGKDDIYNDEKFMAEYYARYVERMAKSARAIYDMPLFVNAAMNSRGRKPGEYPSAGPLAHLMDVWHKAAPSIDMLAPDIYDTGFAGWTAQYATKDNPLFIPESRCCINSGVRALYTFGEHRAVGFSAFAIDQESETVTTHLTRSYDMLRELSPILLDTKAKYQTWGMLFDKKDRERIITDGTVSLTCRHYFTLPWDPRANAEGDWQEGGGIVIRIAQNEYLIAGSGVMVEFKTVTEKQQEERKTLGEDGFVAAGTNKVDKTADKQSSTRFQGKRIGIGYVDQVSINDDGTLRYIRRDNGDQDHQGRHARISVDEYKILHVKLYEY